MVYFLILGNFISYFLPTGWIYVVEMALKIYAFGFMNYWRDGQNQFDFLVTWIIGKYCKPSCARERGMGGGRIFNSSFC